MASFRGDLLNLRPPWDNLFGEAVETFLDTEALALTGDGEER